MSVFDAIFGKRLMEHEGGYINHPATLAVKRCGA